MPHIIYKNMIEVEMCIEQIALKNLLTLGQTIDIICYFFVNKLTKQTKMHTKKF